MPTRLTLHAEDHGLGGVPGTVEILIYDHQAQMLDAVRRYNGNDFGVESLGITQLMTFDNSAPTAIIRLHRAGLHSIVVMHELHHAVTALYGDALPPNTRTSDVLTHYNEPFAHLYGAMCAHLSDWLHRRHYW